MMILWPLASVSRNMVGDDAYVKATDWIKDSNRPNSLAARARDRRWDHFLSLFPDVADMRVLDLGGTPMAWRVMPARPQHVVCVNLDSSSTAEEDWIELVAGDACNLPGSLKSERFDLVFSNSLIEHLGGIKQREIFASVVLDKAPRHWVQTPYRYFPVEPHWVAPGLQFLPLAARALLARSWNFGHMRSTRTTAVDDCLWVELLSKTEMKALFPQSTLWAERFGGLTKSLVAHS